MNHKYSYRFVLLYDVHFLSALQFSHSLLEVQSLAGYFTAMVEAVCCAPKK